jgi:hypothetical protein
MNCRVGLKGLGMAGSKVKMTISNNIFDLR